LVAGMGELLWNRYLDDESLFLPKKSSGSQTLIVGFDDGAGHVEHHIKVALGLSEWAAHVLDTRSPGHERSSSAGAPHPEASDLRWASIQRPCTLPVEERDRGT